MRVGSAAGGVGLGGGSWSGILNAKLAIEDKDFGFPLAVRLFNPVRIDYGDIDGRIAGKYLEFFD